MGHQLNCTRLILITKLILQPIYAVPFTDIDMHTNTNTDTDMYTDETIEPGHWRGIVWVSWLVTNAANVLRWIEVRHFWWSTAFNFYNIQCLFVMLLSVCFWCYNHQHNRRPIMATTTKIAASNSIQWIFTFVFNAVDRKSCQRWYSLLFLWRE